MHMHHQEQQCTPCSLATHTSDSIELFIHIVVHDAGIRSFLLPIFNLQRREREGEREREREREREKSYGKNNTSVAGPTTTDKVMRKGEVQIT